MKRRIKKDNETYAIDCEDNMCGKCNFNSSVMKCELFDINLDHVRGGLDKYSGWRRCSECKNSEVKTNLN
jgi:hypothetical protein